MHVYYLKIRGTSYVRFTHCVQCPNKLACTLGSAISAWMSHCQQLLSAFITVANCANYIRFVALHFPLT